MSNLFLAIAKIGALLCWLVFAVLNLCLLILAPILNIIPFVRDVSSKVIDLILLAMRRLEAFINE